MNIALKTMLALLIAAPTLASACGGYGSFGGMFQLPSKHLATKGFERLTAETYHYYLDDEGQEIRHGLATQFDAKGNVVGHAKYRHGKIWDGSRARIYMGCGIGASRDHFTAGVRKGNERLKGGLVGKLGNKDFGFVVNPDQVIMAKVGQESGIGPGPLQLSTLGSR